MIIGNGLLQFEVNHHFGKLPASYPLGYTHGICVDLDSNVFVFNQSKAAVLQFDREGKFITSWGEEYQHGAHGMRLTDEESRQFLYLTDYEKHVVVKLTLRGQEMLRFEVPPRKDLYAGLQDFKPTDVCVAPDSNVYIFDGYGKGLIHIYDKHARYLKTIGTPGSEPGQLNCPHGGWIDTRRVEPELYVADRGNNRIQVFTLDGTFKRIITDPAIKQPCGFYQYADELWIPDLQAQMVVLDGQDKVKAVLGDDASAPKLEGWPNVHPHLQEGKFNSPHACCVDVRGDVYVVEWMNPGRITKMTRMSVVPETMRPKPGRM